MIWSKLAVLLAVALLGVAAGGCRHDAHVSARDTGPAEKVNMPDGYDTIATKCNHGNRLYETDSNVGLAVVPGDATCRRAP